MKPLLSICIPTYNRAELLDLTLENVLGQTRGLGDVEVVVSDNASTDGTQEVLARHPGLVTDRLPRTVGVTKNIEHVVCDMARGEYVWLVGDDDLVIAGGLARVLDFLRAHPDLGYVYLNFGWIDALNRETVIRDRGSVPEVNAFTEWQFQDLGTHVLPRLEDLVALPCKNPSVIFSLLICYVARRDMYLQRWGALQPSESLDGSSILIDDCNPHGKVVTEHFAGQPVGYIGEPCILQGLNGWQWRSYAIKNNLFGTSQFLTWLEGSPFDPRATQSLWASFYQMAGRLYAEMLLEPGKHLGQELVLEHVVRPGALQPGFWEAFQKNSRLYHERDYEAAFLLEEVQAALGPDLKRFRIGVWGALGRGTCVIKGLQEMGCPPVWVGDKLSSLQGRELEGTGLPVSPLSSLGEAGLDLLVIAVSRQRLDSVQAMAGEALAAIGTLVTLRGSFQSGRLRCGQVSSLAPFQKEDRHGAGSCVALP